MRCLAALRTCNGIVDATWTYSPRHSRNAKREGDFDSLER